MQRLQYLDQPVCQGSALLQRSHAKEQRKGRKRSDEERATDTEEVTITRPRGRKQQHQTGRTRRLWAEGLTNPLLTAGARKDRTVCRPPPPTKAQPTVVSLQRAGRLAPSVSVNV